MKTHKELKEEYKRRKIPMGIYQVKNISTGKILIGSSTNLDGIFNRIRFSLNYGSHVNKELQNDWNKLGEEHFKFEVLDKLEPKEGEEINYKEELVVLEQLWLEKIKPYNEKGYNKPPSR